MKNILLPDSNTTESNCIEKAILSSKIKFKVIWKLRKFFKNKYLNVLFINFAWQLFVEIVK